MQCDLTGEVGRYAVACATKRNSEGVKQCLVTNMSILHALETVSMPGKLGKKVDPLRKSVEKLEQMLFELSLIEHGRNIPSESGNVEIDESTAMEDDNDN